MCGVYTRLSTVVFLGIETFVPWPDDPRADSGYKLGSLWVSCCMTASAHIEVLHCALVFGAQWNPSFFCFTGLKGSCWCTRQARDPMAVFWERKACDVPHGLWEQSRTACGAGHLPAVRPCSERALEGLWHPGSLQPEERVSAGEWALFLGHVTVSHVTHLNLCRMALTIQAGNCFKS